MTHEDPQRTPLHETLGVSARMPSAALAAMLQTYRTTHMVEVGGVLLDDYYEDFLDGPEAAGVRQVYDLLVHAVATGEPVGISLSEPTVQIALELAGLDRGQIPLPGAGAQPSSSQSVVVPEQVPKQHGTTTTPKEDWYGPVEVPPGRELVPVEVRDRLRLLLAWILFPSVVLAAAGLLWTYGEPVIWGVKSHHRSPSIVADSVAETLTVSHQKLIELQTLLLELDEVAERTALTPTPWHDPDTESLPQAVRKWLLPAVRTAAARRKQDELLGQYLALVRARADLHQELAALLQEVNRTAPSYAKGAELRVSFDAATVNAKADRALVRAASLVTQMKSLPQNSKSLEGK